MGEEWARLDALAVLHRLRRARARRGRARRVAARSSPSTGGTPTSARPAVDVDPRGLGARLVRARRARPRAAARVVPLADRVAAQRSRAVRRRSRRCTRRMTRSSLVRARAGLVPRRGQPGRTSRPWSRSVWPIPRSCCRGTPARWSRDRCGWHRSRSPSCVVADRLRRVRLLLPRTDPLAAVDQGDVGLADLAALYARPDLTAGRSWVRANFVSSLDGAATGSDGRRLRSTTRRTRASSTCCVDCPMSSSSEPEPLRLRATGSSP